MPTQIHCDGKRSGILGYAAKKETVMCGGEKLTAKNIKGM